MGGDPVEPGGGGDHYDMWGLVHPGIRQFKEGFGGREVALIGAWDLPLSGVGWRTYRLAEGRRRTPRVLTAEATPAGTAAGTGRSHRGRGRMSGIARARRPWR